MLQMNTSHLQDQHTRFSQNLYPECVGLLWRHHKWGTSEPWAAPATHLSTIMVLKSVCNTSFYEPIREGIIRGYILEVAGCTAVKAIYLSLQLSVIYQSHLSIAIFCHLYFTIYQPIIMYLSCLSYISAIIYHLSSIMYLSIFYQSIICISCICICHFSFICHPCIIYCHLSIITFLSSVICHLSSTIYH